MPARPERIPPGPGQESVWDYPRPPRLEDTARHIQVIFAGTVIADSRRAKRVLETNHAPTCYLPPDDVHLEYFKPSPRRTVCATGRLLRRLDNPGRCRPVQGRTRELGLVGAAQR
jgi:uncharacterized protein (DUF427 family)